LEEPTESKLPLDSFVNTLSIEEKELFDGLDLNQRHPNYKSRKFYKPNL
jgi:hypothetical protein